VGLRGAKKRLSGKGSSVGYEICMIETRTPHDEVVGDRTVTRWEPGWTGRIVFLEKDGKETRVHFPEDQPQPHGPGTPEGRKRIHTELSEWLSRLEHHYETTGKRWELEPEWKAERERKLAAAKKR